ncbi:MAG: hypothetical protein VZS44_01315 [Bacilli bacterium]|nr:hypothetical protein [Bacilli bacterium]
MEKIKIDYLRNLEIVRKKNRSRYASDFPNNNEETDEEYVKRLGLPIANLTQGNFNITYLGKLTIVQDSNTVYPKLILPQEMLASITNNDSSITTIEFGEYPQNKVEPELQQELEQLYKQKNASSIQIYQQPNANNSQELKPTGNTYTIPTTTIKETRRIENPTKIRFIKGGHSNPYNTTGKTNKTTYEEYEYKNKKYIRYVYSDIIYGTKEEIWLEVSPVTWIIEDGILYAKQGLFNTLLENNKEEDDSILGIKTHYKYLTESYKETKQFLETQFLKDLLQTVHLSKVIKYNTFIELEMTIKDNNYELKDGITEIVLDGPTLTKQEMNKIKALVPSEIKISYGSEIKNINSKYSKYHEDIQALLNKISIICNNLPSVAKKNVFDEVDKLLDEYDKDIVELEPKFGFDTPFSYNGKDIENLKPILLSKLEIIIMMLNSEEKAINYLSRLSNYKKLLSQNNLSIVGDTSTTEAKINNILAMSNEMNTSKKESIYKELINYIDEAIKEVSKQLEKGIDTKPDYSFQEDFDVDKRLELNISKLYDEVSIYYDKSVPFEKLKSSLEGNGRLPEIDEILKGINIIINDSSKNKHKEEIENKYNEIKTKYINMINNILNNSNLLKTSNYERIELNLRRELQELLLVVKKYEILDLFKPDKYNKDSLIKELKESKEIVKNNKKVELTEEDKLKAITSTVKELNNYLIDNDIKLDIKNEIVVKLMDDINSSLEELEGKAINNKKEYDKELRKILGKIMKLQLETEVYTKEEEKYKKIIK